MHFSNEEIEYVIDHYSKEAILYRNLIIGDSELNLMNANRLELYAEDLRSHGRVTSLLGYWDPSKPDPTIKSLIKIRIFYFC